MKRGPMDPVDSVRIVAGQGITGNADQGGRRQVTIIEQELWNGMMAGLSASLPPETRRANLMVSGIGLANSEGRVLQVGKRNVEIRALEPVGSYAVQPQFSDGHNTGIYSWEYLYELGEEQEKLWSQYLEKLASAGASRE